MNLNISQIWVAISNGRLSDITLDTSIFDAYIFRSDDHAGQITPRCQRSCRVV